MDLRISEDAGHYLCDFIYFSSLAHLYKAGERRRVVFLHVPSDASEHSIATGTEVMLQLVRSVVESEMARRRRAAEAGIEGTSCGAGASGRWAHWS
jgi:pyrrolidone-carboxylate peptidase